MAPTENTIARGMLHFGFGPRQERVHACGDHRPEASGWYEDHRRGQARLHRPGPRHRRVLRRLDGLPGRSARPRPGQPAAGHQRRRGGPDRRNRAVLPQGTAQRCLIHRCRNLLAKILAGMQAEVKDAYGKIFDTEDLTTPPGPELVKIIEARIDELAAGYRAAYPAAVNILHT